MYITVLWTSKIISWITEIYFQNRSWGSKACNISELFCSSFITVFITTKLSHIEMLSINISLSFNKHLTSFGQRYVLVHTVINLYLTVVIVSLPHHPRWDRCRPSDHTRVPDPPSYGKVVLSPWPTNTLSHWCPPLHMTRY